MNVELKHVSLLPEAGNRLLRSRGSTFGRPCQLPDRRVARMTLTAPEPWPGGCERLRLPQAIRSGRIPQSRVPALLRPHDCLAMSCLAMSHHVTQHILMCRLGARNVQTCMFRARAEHSQRCEASTDHAVACTTHSTKVLHAIMAAPYQYQY